MRVLLGVIRPAILTPVKVERRLTEGIKPRVFHLTSGRLESKAESFTSPGNCFCRIFIEGRTEQLKIGRSCSTLKINTKRHSQATVPPEGDGGLQFAGSY
jgi:hypothetical protein